MLYIAIYIYGTESGIIYAIYVNYTYIYIYIYSSLDICIRINVFQTYFTTNMPTEIRAVYLQDPQPPKGLNSDPLQAYPMAFSDPVLPLDLPLTIQLGIPHKLEPQNLHPKQPRLGAPPPPRFEGWPWPHWDP